MLVALAQLGTAVFTAWLALAALVMLWAPDRALALVGRMGSTPLIHFGEHALRLLAGLSLAGVSPVARGGDVFLSVGAFIVVSSVLIMLAPRRWHAAYASWWASRLPPILVLVLAVPTLAVCGVIVWAVWHWPS